MLSKIMATSQDKIQESNKPNQNGAFTAEASDAQPLDRTDKKKTSTKCCCGCDEGGWGYLIVASVFMANFSLLGWFQTQSFFFVEWKREFNTTSVEASLLVSIGLVILGIASPIGSILATIFGNRKVVMVGGVFVASGMIGTMFMHSILGIILTWGVMIGLGLGLCYSPSVVMIGQYFDKHFTVANGIAYAGGAMGQIFIPLLSGSLIDVFGWRGAVWLLAAIMSHLVVGGAVLRPNVKRQDVKRLRKRTRKKDDNHYVYNNSGFEHENDTGISMVSRDLSGIDTTSFSQDNVSFYDGNNSQTNKTATPKSVHNAGGYDNKAFQKDSDIELLSVTKLPSSLSATEVLASNLTGNKKKNDHNDRRSKSDSSDLTKMDSSNGQTYMNGARSSHEDNNDVEQNITQGSGDSMKSEERSTCMSVVKILVSNICFDLILIVFFIMGFIFFTPVAHAIPRAMASGIDEYRASLLPTIFGVGSLVGRLGPSFMTDCFQIPRDVINISGFVLCTIGNIFNPFFRDFWYHVLYHLLYGGATGCLTVFTFTLIQTVLQKEHRVFGVGLATLFLCIGDTAGSLLAGWLVDVTGDYDFGSWLLSGLSALGALLLLVVALIIRRKKTLNDIDKEPMELETLQ